MFSGFYLLRNFARLGQNNVVQAATVHVLHGNSMFNMETVVKPHHMQFITQELEITPNIDDIIPLSKFISSVNQKFEAFNER